MLRKLIKIIEKSCERIGRCATTLAVSIATGVLFCNQRIAVLMCNSILAEPYESTGGTRQELAIDLENSVIVIIALIPWSVACSVPLTFFDVGVSSLIWASYLYLVPVIYFLQKRNGFPINRETDFYCDFKRETPLSVIRIPCFVDPIVISPSSANSARNFFNLYSVRPLALSVTSFKSAPRPNEIP